MYIGDKMTEIQIKKVRVGKAEKKVLEFLKIHPEGVWKEDILNEFASSSKYRNIMIARLYKMQEKGLIEIRTELNPKTGRSKQRVYLKQ